VQIQANKGNIKRSKRVIETKLLHTMGMEKCEVNGQSKQIGNGLEKVKKRGKLQEKLLALP